MVVLESSCLPKRFDADGDDVLVITDSFLAIIDGATAKDEETQAVSGGRRCAEAAAAALHQYSGNGNLEGFLVHATRLVADVEVALRPRSGWPYGPPSCSAIILSVARREIWAIGEGLCKVGQSVFRLETPIESLAARARSLVLESLLRDGVPIDELAESDPGRLAALPMLQLASRFRNAVDSPWGFAALDGTRVPPELVRVIPIPDGEREGILASDGYPILGHDLQSSERLLVELEAKDRLFCHEYMATKCRKKDERGFDDRSLIHFEIG